MFLLYLQQSDTKHRCCRIIAYIPSSHYHSDEDYNEHLAALKRAWNEIVNADLKSNQSRKELHSIHIVQTAAVSDMGIIGPKVRLRPPIPSSAFFPISACAPSVSSSATSS